MAAGATNAYAMHATETACNSQQTENVSREQALIDESAIPSFVP